MPFFNINGSVDGLRIDHVYIGNPDAKPTTPNAIVTFDQIDDLIESIIQTKRERTYNGQKRHVLSVLVVIYHQKQPTCSVVYASGLRERILNT